MGQAVGAGVELGVAQAHLAEGQRRASVRCTWASISCWMLCCSGYCSAVAFHVTRVLALGSRQQWQFGHRLVRLLDDAAG